MRVLSIVSLFLSLGCVQVPKSAPLAAKGTLVASMQPVAPVHMNEPEVLEEPQTASVYLERAFQFFAANRFERAAADFDRAVGTGNLNDAGRTLAYWHVYVAQSQLGRVDAAHEALSSFIIVAEDLVDVRDAYPNAFSSHSDFISRFQLRSRLARARATIFAAWSQRASDFGRTLDNPVPVKTNLEQSIFLEMTNDCARDGIYTVERVETENDSVEKVLLSCGEDENDEESPERFFFERAP